MGKAQSVDWRPVQTRRGSAPRGLPSRKPSANPSPRTPISVDSGDIMARYARGTNGPARPNGSDPREGRGAQLGRKSTSPAPEGNDLAPRYGRNSRQPSAVSNNRFGFVNSRRNSAQPRSSVNKSRPNPQYERSAHRDRGMSKSTWRSAAPKTNWE